MSRLFGETLSSWSDPFEQDNKVAFAISAELSHQELLTEAEESLIELLTQLIERFEEEHDAFSEDDGIYASINPWLSV